MIVAIASGKGGTGKTFVATNLFHTLQRHGVDSILVDCDAEAPNDAFFFDLAIKSQEEVFQQVPAIDPGKCTFCGKCHEYCHYNAIFFLPPMKVIQAMEDLCHGCGACTVACEYGAITEKPASLGTVSDFSLNGYGVFLEARMRIGAISPVKVIKAAIKKARNARGTVLLDAPPGTSCPFIHTVAAADYVILVAEPTPFGLSDLRQSVETLKAMDKPVGVIINRAGIGDSKVHNYLLEEHIELLIEIPFDREIARINSGGGMAADTFPELQQDLLNMYHKLAERWK